MKYYLEDCETAVEFKHSPDVYIKHYHCYDNSWHVHVRQSTIAAYKRLFKKCAELRNIFFLSPKLLGNYGAVEDISTDGLNYCQINLIYKHALDNQDKTFVIVRLEGTAEYNLMLYFLPIKPTDTLLRGIERKETIKDLLKSL